MIKHFINFTNPESNETITIDITNSENIKEVIDKLREFPKDENGYFKFGNILIHQFGGASIK